MLDITNLRVRIDTAHGVVEAVRGVDLSVAPGEIVALVGESGSGKTMTARSVLGLLPASATASGRVLVGDVDVLADGPGSVRGSKVAMVFQEPSTALNPVYPVGWQIAEGLRAHGFGGKAARRARAIEALADVGIPDSSTRVDHYPHQFSGGQKQRIMIAAALALDPGLIVADEPTSALDVTVQAEILDLLRKVRSSSGTAILLITHNMGVVADIADRVAVMHQGRIVESAPVIDLFASPQDPYTRSLLAAIPELGRGRDGNSSPLSVTPFPGTRSGDPDSDGEDGEGSEGGEGGEGGEVVVEADGLRVEFRGRFGRKAFRAVDGVSLRIEAGEVLGLVGESGSGKTTIGRAIAGLAPVSGGELSVLGERPNGRRLGARVGFVFQDPATSFNPQLTIGECVAEPIRVHAKGVDPKKRVGELLELVALPREFAKRYPHELSGGQRQRASIARALALGPKLLIADEPTSALDVSVQATILDLLLRLHRELGFAALFISHDLAVVETVASRVAVLHRGRIVESGPTGRVLSAPEHDYTRRLVAAVPVPDPVRQAARREGR